MNTIGRHILGELYGCDSYILDDLDQIRQYMLEAAAVIGASVVGTTFHRFAPQGVTGIVSIAESHLSIHTWPERCYVALDIYTCGMLNPMPGVNQLALSLKARSCRFYKLLRGLPEDFANADTSVMHQGELLARLVSERSI